MTDKRIDVSAEALGLVLAQLDLAAWDMADAGSALSGSEAGTSATARKRLMDARHRVDNARALLSRETACACGACACGKKLHAPGGIMGDRARHPQDEGFA